MRLARTVDRWNALVASGEDTELDLFSTSKGTFASPTGVRAAPVLTPPFHAVEVWPLTRKSMGGVAIDMECRVARPGAPADSRPLCRRRSRRLRRAERPGVD